jgi:hypothetical protein
MDSRDYLAWLADAEFTGGSFNGPALLETLKSLTAEEALSTDTYEAYSAWGVVLHVLYYKYLVGRELGASFPAYDHEETNWPSLPDDAGPSTYESMIEELVTFHEALMTAFRDASPDALEAPMPGWDTSLGRAFAWLVAHDTNHNTQIRNMGLPSLRKN